MKSLKGGWKEIPILPGSNKNTLLTPVKIKENEELVLFDGSSYIRNNVGSVTQQGSVWDVSNLKLYANVDLANKMISIFFSPNGKKLFSLEYSNRLLKQYSLTKPWNISSVDYDNIYFDIKSATPDNPTPYGLYFSSDGRKVFIGNYSDRIYQYILDNPWDISSVKSDGAKTIDAGGAGSFGITDFVFSSDGTKLYFLGNATDNVYQYSLSTPWDISNVSQEATLDISSHSNAPHGIFFNPDGTKMFVVDMLGNGKICQYNLSTPWDITTAGYNGCFTLDSGGSDVFIEPNGKFLFITSQGKIAQYYMQYNSIDISSFSLTSTPSKAFKKQSPAIWVSKVFEQEETDNDWYQYQVTVTEKPKEIKILSGSDKNTLKTVDEIVTGEKVILYNSVDGVKEGEIGDVTGSVKNFTELGIKFALFNSDDHLGIHIDYNDSYIFTIGQGASRHLLIKYDRFSLQPLDVLYLADHAGSEDLLICNGKLVSLVDNKFLVVLDQNLNIETVRYLSSTPAKTIGASRLYYENPFIYWVFSWHDADDNGFGVVKVSSLDFSIQDYRVFRSPFSSTDVVDVTATSSHLVIALIHSYDSRGGYFSIEKNSLNITDSQVASMNSQPYVTTINDTIYVSYRNSDGVRKVISSDGAGESGVCGKLLSYRDKIVVLSDNLLAVLDSSNLNFVKALRITTNVDNPTLFDIHYENLGSKDYFLITGKFEYDTESHKSAIPLIRLSYEDIGQDICSNESCGDFGSDIRFTCKSETISLHASGSDFSNYSSYSQVSVNLDLVETSIYSTHPSLNYTGCDKRITKIIFREADISSFSLTTPPKKAWKKPTKVYVAMESNPDRCLYFDEDISDKIQNATTNSFEFVDSRKELVKNNDELVVNGKNVNVSNVTTSGSWDITTSSYESDYYIGDQNGAPISIFFHSDGTKLYVLDEQYKKVHQYNLSTPWDLTTASHITYYYVGDQDSNPQGIFFHPDGSKMYVVSYTKIYQYRLSAPWDVSTATFESDSYIADQDSTVSNLFFHPDGTKVYIVGEQYAKVYQYNLSTPWDITTVSFVSSYSVSGQDNRPIRYLLSSRWYQNVCSRF